MFIRGSLQYNSCPKAVGSTGLEAVRLLPWQKTTEPEGVGGTDGFSTAKFLLAASNSARLRREKLAQVF